MLNYCDDLPNRKSIRRNGVFFVTDAGFLAPTIIAAAEVRRKTPIDFADIRIVMIDIPYEVSQRLKDNLAALGIFVDTLSKEYFFTFDHNLYNKTHVPISALGRFFMLECAPDIYGRILYLDGDTWLNGSLVDLLNSQLPIGKFAASEDKSYYYRHEIGRTGLRVRNYFSDIGINGDHGYFNSGVLLADVETWRMLSNDAFSFFRRNPKICMYHDQSALNAVAGDRRVRLSPRWNYLSDYFDWGITGNISPQIVHFAGGGKPWKIPTHSYHQKYVDAQNILRNLHLRFETFSDDELRANHRFALRENLRAKTVFWHRRPLRRQMFKSLVELSYIA